MQHCISAQGCVAIEVGINYGGTNAVGTTVGTNADARAEGYCATKSSGTASDAASCDGTAANVDVFLKPAGTSPLSIVYTCQSTGQFTTLPSNPSCRAITVTGLCLGNTASSANTANTASSANTANSANSANTASSEPDIVCTSGQMLRRDAVRWAGRSQGQCCVTGTCDGREDAATQPGNTLSTPASSSSASRAVDQAVGSQFVWTCSPSPSPPATVTQTCTEVNYRFTATTACPGTCDGRQSALAKPANTGELMSLAHRTARREIGQPPASTLKWPCAYSSAYVTYTCTTSTTSNSASSAFQSTDPSCPAGQATAAGRRRQLVLVRRADQLSTQRLASSAYSRLDVAAADAGSFERSRRQLAAGDDGTECTVCTAIPGAKSITCTMPMDSRVTCLPGYNHTDNSNLHRHSQLTDASDTCLIADSNCLTNWNGSAAKSQIAVAFPNAFCTVGLMARTPMPDLPCAGAVCTVNECCADTDACPSAPCSGQGSVCLDDPAPSIGYTCACQEGWYASSSLFNASSGDGCNACTAVRNALTVRCDDSLSSRVIMCAEGYTRMAGLVKGVSGATASTADACVASSCVCPAGSALKSPLVSVAAVDGAITSNGSIPVASSRLSTFSVGQQVRLAQRALLRQQLSRLPCASAGVYTVASVNVSKLHLTGAIAADSNAASRCDVVTVSNTWDSIWFASKCSTSTCLTSSCCVPIDACAVGPCTATGARCVDSMVDASYTCACRAGYYRSLPPISAGLRPPMIAAIRRRAPARAGPDGAECLPCSSVAHAATTNCSAACGAAGSAACQALTAASPFVPWPVGRTAATCLPGYRHIDGSATGADDRCVADSSCAVAWNSTQGHAFPPALCHTGLVPKPGHLLSSTPCAGAVCTAAECCDDVDFCATNVDPCTGANSSCTDSAAATGGQGYVCACAPGYYSRLARGKYARNMGPPAGWQPAEVSDAEVTAKVPPVITAPRLPQRPPPPNATLTANASMGRPPTPPPAKLGGFVATCDGAVDTATGLCENERYIYFIPITNDLTIDDLKSQIDDTLVRYTWIDSQTRDVEVRFAVYNGNYKLFALVQVMFEFDVGGQLEKRIKISVLDLELEECTSNEMKALQSSSTAGCLMTDFWSRKWWKYLLLIAYVGLTASGELADMWDAYQFMGSPLHYFTDFWNYIDAGQVVAYLICGLYFIVLRTTDVKIGQRFNWGPSAPVIDGETGEQALLKITNAITDASVTFANYKIISVLNLFLLMVRFFKFCRYQPKLAMVNNTLIKAADGLLHFGIIFLAVLMLFMVQSKYIYGSTLEGFSENSRARNSLFQALLGAYNEQMIDQETFGSLGVSFFFVYMILNFLIMVNFFLAIVMEAYEDAKSETAMADGVVEGTWSLLKVWWASIRRASARCRGVAKAGVRGDALTVRRSMHDATKYLASATVGAVSPAAQLGHGVHAEPTAKRRRLYVKSQDPQGKVQRQLQVEVVVSHHMQKAIQKVETKLRDMRRTRRARRAAKLLGGERKDTDAGGTLGSAGRQTSSTAEMDDTPLNEPDWVCSNALFTRLMIHTKTECNASGRGIYGKGKAHYTFQLEDCEEMVMWYHDCVAKDSADVLDDDDNEVDRLVKETAVQVQSLAGAESGKEQRLTRLEEQQTLMLAQLATQQQMLTALLHHAGVPTPGQPVPTTPIRPSITPSASKYTIEEETTDVDQLQESFLAGLHENDDASDASVADQVNELFPPPPTDGTPVRSNRLAEAKAEAETGALDTDLQHYVEHEPTLHRQTGSKLGI
jgi:hypothetical protein